MKLIEYNFLYSFLSDDIETKLRNIMYSIECIENRLFDKTIEVLLDEDDVAFLHSYYDSQEKLDYVQINDADELIILQSLKAICAYCVVYNRLSDYDKLTLDIWDDIPNFLDRAKINNVFVENGNLDINNLVTFILNYLERKKVLIK